MKYLMTALAMTVAVTLMAAPAQAPADASPASAALVAARGKITEVIKDPKKMTAAIKGLSAKEQLTFLADVNKAIAKLPGSNEEKAAIFLNVNHNALLGAAKGNLQPMVAEIYATVPVSALTVINERFASDVFNRAANPKVTYTDKQFIAVVQGVMKTIVARLETAEDGGVRAGFAALMMVRASNSATPEIQAAVIETLPKSVRETAKSEWFPAALAGEDNRSYEPMLGMSAGEATQPVREEVLRIAGVQESDAMLADLSGPNADPSLTPPQAQPVIDAVYAPIQNDMPRATVGDAASDAGAQIGRVQQEREYHGYPDQTTK